MTHEVSSVYPVTYSYFIMKFVFMKHSSIETKYISHKVRKLIINVLLISIVTSTVKVRTQNRHTTFSPHFGNSSGDIYTRKYINEKNKGSNLINR